MAWSIAVRASTDGPKPSSLTTVTPLAWAAAAGSACEPMARDIRATASAGSSPSTPSDTSVCDRGSTLRVTSVRAASRPQLPAISLQRS